MSRFQPSHVWPAQKRQQRFSGQAANVSTDAPSHQRLRADRTRRLLDRGRTPGRPDTGRTPRTPLPPLPRLPPPLPPVPLTRRGGEDAPPHANSAGVRARKVSSGRP